MFPAIALPCLRFPARTGSWSQSRLARLVAGPFWGWNCTGGRPSVHWNTSHNTFFHNQGRVDWLTVYRLTNWCIAYTDEVVFREAAGCDVVLQELLGKVLVHLSSLVGVNGISTSLVEICWEKIIVSTADHGCSFMFHKYGSEHQIHLWTCSDVIKLLQSDYVFLLHSLCCLFPKLCPLFNSVVTSLSCIDDITEWGFDISVSSARDLSQYDCWKKRLQQKIIIWAPKTRFHYYQLVSVG